MTPQGPAAARAGPPRFRAPAAGASEATSWAGGVRARRVSEILSRATVELATDVIGVIEANKCLGKEPIWILSDIIRHIGNLLDGRLVP